MPLAKNCVEFTCCRHVLVRSELIERYRIPELSAATRIRFWLVLEVMLIWLIRDVILSCVD